MGNALFSSRSPSARATAELRSATSYCDAAGRPEAKMGRIPGSKRARVEPFSSIPEQGLDCFSWSAPSSAGRKNCSARLFLSLFLFPLLSSSPVNLSFTRDAINANTLSRLPREVTAERASPLFARARLYKETGTLRLLVEGMCKHEIL